ncbi:hypothetical protein [Roseospira marina]|nr:hypothetical protein [Roseospira marina]
MTPPPNTAPDCDADRCPYADDLVDRIAANVGRHAAREFFAMLGVDVRKPAEVEEFRRDLRFAGFLRRHTDKAIGGVITAIALGALALLWGGAQFVMGGPKP